MHEPDPAPMILNRRDLLLLAVGVEGALLAIAATWAQLSGLPIWRSMHPDGRAALWIAAFTLLLAVVNISAFAQLRRRVAAMQRFDRLLTAMFAQARLPDLALISLLAGLGEETLFRGVLQPQIGLVGAAILFGCMHFVALDLWFYTVWAIAIGILFGYLYLLTGNLLVPVAVHAAYDFVALLFIRYRPADPPKALFTGSGE